jgi:hypothetical protein
LFAGCSFHVPVNHVVYANNSFFSVFRGPAGPVDIELPLTHKWLDVMGGKGVDSNVSLSDEKTAFVFLTAMEN